MRQMANFSQLPKGRRPKPTISEYPDVKLPAVRKQEGIVGLGEDQGRVHNPVQIHQIAGQEVGGKVTGS